MLCFLPTQNVVQEGGGPQQATGAGAYGSTIEVLQNLSLRWPYSRRLRSVHVSAYRMSNLQRSRSLDACVGYRFIKSARTPSRTCLTHHVRAKGVESISLLELLSSPLDLDTFSRCLNRVTAVGSQCSLPLGEGSAGQDEPYWFEKIKHQGLSAYNKDPANYRTFRNVKDFGAKGDGTSDDTQAILFVGTFPYLHAVADYFH